MTARSFLLHFSLTLMVLLGVLADARAQATLVGTLTVVITDNFQNQTSQTTYIITAYIFRARDASGSFTTLVAASVTPVSLSVSPAAIEPVSGSKPVTYVFTGEPK